MASIATAKVVEMIVGRYKKKYDRNSGNCNIIFLFIHFSLLIFLKISFFLNSLMRCWLVNAYGFTFVKLLWYINYGELLCGFGRRYEK